MQIFLNLKKKKSINLWTTTTLSSVKSWVLEFKNMFYKGH